VWCVNARGVCIVRGAVFRDTCSARGVRDAVFRDTPIFHSKLYKVGQSNAQSAKQNV